MNIRGVAEMSEELIFQKSQNQTGEPQLEKKFAPALGPRRLAMREANEAMMNALELCERAVVRQSAELDIARENAKAAEIERSDFLSSMSHEIRTAMTGILGIAGTLMKSDLDENKKHSMQIIVQSGVSLLQTLNDILEYSNLESSHLNLSQEALDVGSLVNEATSHLSASISTKDLELIIQIEPDTPAEVIGDRLRLKQVLIHFIGNAVKNPDAGLVWVSVKPVKEPMSEGDKQKLKFEVVVCENGSRQDRQSINAEKSTLDNGTNSENQWEAERGLTICSAIIQKMGGSFGMNSEPGDFVNCWFEATFPVSKKLRSEIAAAGKVRGQRILIYDTNPQALAARKNQLCMYGFDCAGVCSHREIGAFLSFSNSVETPMNAIIINEDIDLAQELSWQEHKRSDEAADQIPIILLENPNSRLLEMPVFEIDSLKILQKPILHGQLEKALSELLAPVHS